MPTRNRFILGFAAGAAIGTAAALLAAPKTGKETRHIVTQGAGRFAAPLAGQHWPASSVKRQADTGVPFGGRSTKRKATGAGSNWPKGNWKWRVNRSSGT